METKYEPYPAGRGRYAWFDGEMFPDHFDPSNLPRSIFTLLKGSEISSPADRKRYPTREAALADLAQAQERLKAMEAATVKTTTATTSVVESGKLIELKDVLPEDTVRLERQTTNMGYELSAKGVVASTTDELLRLKLSVDRHATWLIDDETHLYLLHRPPQRREVTLDQLIREVPIGTRVTLVKENGGEIDGTLQVVGRDGRGLGVYFGPNISSTIYVNLDDFKTAYIEGEST